jgi:hypothetical protein
MIGSNISSPGFMSEKFSVSIAFLGKRIDNFEEKLFNKILLRFDYFEDWLSIPSIKRKFITDDSGTFLGFDFSYRRPISVRVDLNDLSISIQYGVELNGRRDINLTQTGCIQAESIKGKTISEWRSEIIKPLINFLTLGISIETTCLETLKVLCDDKDEQSYAEVIYRPFNTQKKNIKSISRYQMLFSYVDISHKFDEVIKKWLTVSSKLDSVCNLFLPIIQAIESYHRVSGKFNYKKKFNLRERLSDIYDMNIEILKPIIEDKDKFIKTVVSTRNHNTHFNNNPNDPIFTSRDFYWATRILGYIVQACLLSEIGFSKEEIGKLFRKNEDYGYAEQYIQKHYFTSNKQVSINNSPEDESDPLIGMFSLSPTASISTEPFSAEELLTLEGKL